jgi:hypothetical protein
MRTRRDEIPKVRRSGNGAANPKPLHTQFFDQYEGRLPDVIDEHTLGTLNTALAFVFALLREARRQFDEEGDAGRFAAFTALGALWRFAALFQKPYAEGLHVPIVALMNALQALDGNFVLPIVRPSPGPGRPPSDQVHLALKGHSAAAVRRLVDSGLDRKRAHEAVAKALRKAGARTQRGTGALTSTTVRNWCREVDKAEQESTSAAIYDETLTDGTEKQFSRLLSDGNRLGARHAALTALSRWVQCHTADRKIVKPHS